VRTISSPEWSHKRTREEITRFVSEYIRQPNSLGTDIKTPRHRFQMTAFTEDDFHILELLFECFPRNNMYFLRGVEKLDIEIHMSDAHATTPTGRKILQRCQEEDLQTIIHGVKNDDCDEELLLECDYVIDLHNSTHQSDYWFWYHARPGIPEDNMLTNPKYDTEKLKLGRWNRITYSAWTPSSGAYHGNGIWSCSGCGGKCKRGRCKVKPSTEEVSSARYKIPEKGSAEWRDFTAADVCRLYWNQSTPGKSHERDDWSSIDTFSGD
jgi:hypothetical protein